MPKGFTVDLNRCTGCQACMLACAIENQLPIDARWRDVLTYNEPRVETEPVFHLSVACHHCDDPACMRGCPSLAYTKDPMTGAVTLDADRCIGCRYCMWMCPYDAPQFNAQSGTVHKCTFCNDRLHQGLEPACVAYCPTTALGIQETNGTACKESVSGFTRSSIGPNVDFIPLSLAFEKEQPDVERASLAPTASVQGHLRGENKVALRSEWTLVLFTIMIPTAVGWFSASVAGGHHIPALPFVGIGIVAMGLSTLHLGQKKRAYRAILNWRTSWLSREVIFVSAFLATSAAYVVGGLTTDSSVGVGLATLAMACGIAALISMDMVYVAAATTRPCWSHSASAILFSTFFFGLVAPIVWVALVSGCIKCILYVMRKAITGDLWLSPSATILAAIRLSIGIFVPLVAATSANSWIPAWMLICCAIGELIDRVDFYREMEIITPRRQMSADLIRNLS